MLEEEKKVKKPKAVLDKKLRKNREARIAQYMAANPLIQGLLVEKLNEDLAAVRMLLENGCTEPEGWIRFFQGQIKSMKDMLNLVSFPQ